MGPAAHIKSYTDPEKILTEYLRKPSPLKSPPTLQTSSLYSLFSVCLDFKVLFLCLLQGSLMSLSNAVMDVGCSSGFCSKGCLCV